jgi:hypothetical protein
MANAASRAAVNTVVFIAVLLINRLFARRSRKSAAIWRNGQSPLRERDRQRLKRRRQSERQMNGEFSAGSDGPWLYCVNTGT